MSNSIPISQLNVLPSISSSDYIPIVKDSTITTFRVPVSMVTDFILSASVSSSYSITASYAVSSSRTTLADNSYFSTNSISSSWASSSINSISSSWASTSINSYNLIYPNTSTASFSSSSINSISSSWASSSINSISSSWASTTTSSSYSNISTSSSYSLSSSYSNISTSSSYSLSSSYSNYITSYTLAQDSSNTSMISRSINLSPGTWQLILDSRFSIDDFGINYSLTNTQSASLDVNTVNTSVSFRLIGGAGFARNIYGSDISVTTFSISSPLSSLLYLSPPHIPHISLFSSAFHGAIVTVNKVS